MSFLSKRSRSQRSFVRGEEQITVRKLQKSPQIESQQCGAEGSTLSGGVDATDFALYDSCVLRNFPKHKSSHLRFLAWVAYTRKFTDEPITEDERRTCPLLWCRTVFKDQEAMLQHVWECEALSKGLYWCFHCQKPERVGRFFQCKRCQGTPTRADRLTTVAKRIFSKLGSKSSRNHPFPNLDQRMALAETSKVSKGMDDSDYQDIPAEYDAGPANEWGQLSLPEMANTSLRPSLELPDTQICEMSGSDCPLELSAGPETWLVPSYTAPRPSPYIQEPAARLVNPANRGPRRQETNLTPLDTHFKSPSLELNRQQGPPNEWSDEPMSATIISPLSEPDHYASIFQEISPTDTDASGKSFLTDSGYTSATIETACSGSGIPSFELHPGFNQSRGKKRPREADAAPEEQPEGNMVARTSSVQSAKNLVSKIGSVSSSHSPSRCPSTKKPKLESPHWSNAETLIQSFAEVVDAHICHTKAILKDLPPTPITTELLAMSRTSMVSIGLEALAGIIEGRNPTAIVQVFAFTHIAYAFTIAMEDNEMKVHTKEWFQDAMSWVEDLGSERQRNSYLQIANSIWQPANDLSEGDLPRLFGLANQGNRLFLACKRFLDVLESFGFSDPELATTEKAFGFAQPLFARKAQSLIIDELIKTTSIEAFIEDVVKVEKRLDRGHITTIRELELELMCAGKLASQSELAYSRFLSHVTILCNALYVSPDRERSVCYMRDISLIKRLLPEELYGDHHGEEERDFELELDDDLPLDFDIGTLPRCEGTLVQNVQNFMRDADQLMSGSSNGWSHNPYQQHMHNPSPTASSSHTACQNRKPQTSCTETKSRPQQTSPKTSTPNTPANQSPVPDSAGGLSTYQCDLCPYIPLGEEKWKASNLRRHKRTQHAKKGEYICKWPDCGRAFTRSDNLRSHMRDKGHETNPKSKGKGKEKAIEVDEDESDDSEVARHPETHDGDERGAKRRKV
ncbi:hypothetical protein BGZ60DRAFT_532845 [Tricladium varicosporioides]|nr:hypothetical protein BGZ60DRAFT_532845 [Hymenoscyphus varicosporioides]